MWIGGLAGQVIANLGAVPQQIAAGDIYPALERGTIDAAIFTAAAHQAHSMTIAKYEDVNPAAIKRLIVSGKQLRAFSPEIMDACAKAANELYEEICAKNPMFKKLHDHMMAYRNEQLLWQQVAEFNYDAYQIRSRSRR